jgi:hypothetical protein
MEYILYTKIVSQKQKCDEEERVCKTKKDFDFFYYQVLSAKLTAAMTLVTVRLHL